MAFESRDLLLAAAAAVLVLTLSSCASIGTGRSTLVKAEAPSPLQYTGEEFSGFIAASGVELVGLGGDKAHSPEEWREFQKTIYGGSKQQPGAISIHVRDQTMTPPLVAVDASRSSSAEVSKILLDPKLSFQDKEELIAQLRDFYRSLPESQTRLIVHGADLRYRYFPLLTIDVTASLRVADPLSRFDYVAVAIRLPKESRARFVNFSPKAADLYEFTVAQLKQSASLTAKVDPSASLSAVSKSGRSFESSDTTRTVSDDVTRGQTVASGLGFALSDELTREIRTSLDARAAGIHDDGRLFIVELRSNERRRISGTITHDVMLEVPSSWQPGESTEVTYERAAPLDSLVEADVRMVGVVRHVRKRGQTGTFKKAPEPLNDEAFHEVVVKDERVRLWEFDGLPLGRLTETPLPTLRVVTNEADAAFVVRDSAGAVVATGAGKSTEIPLKAGTSVTVEFSPINRTAQAQTYSLSAPAVKVEVAAGGSIAVGNYTINR